MALRIKAVKILDDTLMTPVNRVDTFLGTDKLRNLNVRVELDGAGSAMPNGIPIEIRIQEPKLRRDNMSSMSNPFKTTAKRDKSTRNYTVSVDPSNFRKFLSPGVLLPKVATVVRDGGTSAVLFRSKLANNGWAVRGAAKQPKIGKSTETVTGDVADEQPDARKLFLVGGVEVLEVCVPAGSGLQVSTLTKTWVFIRSPADVFFYSGHGSWLSCNLLLDQGLRPRGETYGDWLTPEFLNDQLDDQVDVLIINGCSVIGHAGMSAGTLDDVRIMPPCAKRWKKLLKKEGGKFGAILGYRGTAPLDQMGKGQIGGDQIALEMAQAMIDLKDDWGSYAKRWVDINAKYPVTRTAAAMDEKGYYFINQKIESAANTHGERTLPGYDAKKPEGTVIGPGPVPEDWGG